MGSRIRHDPKYVFDCFLEVVSPQKENEEAWILQTFPSAQKTKEAESLKQVPQFAFPCKVAITTVQHFSFVLTNQEAKWTFGFCRYAPNSETAIVILSCLPWHELFYKLLNKCAELTQHGDSGELWRFLEAVHSSKIPLPGTVFQVDYGSGNIFTSSTPSLLSLPSIPENRNLTEYFNAVDVNNMLVLFASMLYERRILITSKKLSRLSACVQAANALIYPMSWQHIYIPVLPTQLMEYLYAPMPFLIGVPDAILKRVRRNELGDAVMFDADNNKIETPFADLETIPSEVVANLKRALKSPTQMLGDNVARAFLRALVHLIGGYRDALRYRQGEKITFNEDAFIMSRSASLQPFLEKMLQLQLFMQFIEERLEMLNSGQGFSDEFELECVAFTEKANNKFKNQYSAITHNVRREGGAIVKAVKNKANPAMKEVVRSVKDGSKIVKNNAKDASKQAKASYKSVKSKLKDSGKDDSSSTQSAPSSPTLSRGSSLSRAPDSAQNSPAPGLTRNNTDLNLGSSRILKYERFDPSDEREFSPEFEELPPLEFDIMNDLEEVIMRNRSESSLPAPPIHRALKPSGRESVRSGCSTSGSVPNLTLYHPPAPSQRHARPNHVRHQTLPHVEKLSDSFPHLPQQAPIPHPRLHRKTQGLNAELGLKTDSKETVDDKPRVASVGDLIKLETTQYDTEFDPLVSKNTTNANTAFNRSYEQVAPPSSHVHKPLERTSNPFVRPQNPSTGKYENYVPAGGNNAPQFKQFLHSMTAAGVNTLPNPARSLQPPDSLPSRSSDDLLNEYGLDFNTINLNPQQNVANLSNTNHHHVNGNIPDKTTTTTSSTPNSSFLYNARARGPGYNAVPNSQMMPVNQRISWSQNQSQIMDMYNSRPQQYPARPAQFPPANSQFSSNSSVAPPRQQFPSSAQLLPTSSPAVSKFPQQSCKDILEDLDPLRSSSSSVSASNTQQSLPLNTGSTPNSLQPPTVPKRTKKQWTTFD